MISDSGVQQNIQRQKIYSVITLRIVCLKNCESIEYPVALLCLNHSVPLKLCGQTLCKSSSFMFSFGVFQVLVCMSLSKEIWQAAECCTIASRGL